MADLPEAGAQLVLEGATEFMSNLQSVTSGLSKLVQGLISLSGTSVSTAGAIDSASQRMVTSNQKVSASAQGLVDQYGKALTGIVNQSNTAAAAVEQSTNRMVRAIEEAATASTKSSARSPVGGIGTGNADQGVEEGVKRVNATLAQEEAALARITREQNASSNARVADIAREMSAIVRNTEAYNQYANTVRNSYAQIRSSVTSYMLALQAASNEERAALRTAANQFAPKVQGYNEVTTAIRAQMIALSGLYQAEQTGAGSSLNFVRSITALVTANNLLNVGALNTLFNIGMLASTFDRAGKGAMLMAGGVGVALAAISSLVTAFGNIVGAGVAVIQTIGDITAKVIDFGVKAGQSALEAATKYQNAMAFFVALTGAPIEDLQMLNDKIFQVATTTKVGMPGAIDAINELGRAGSNASQIINDGALDATIALFTAANGELIMSDAAKTVTGSVGAFTKVLADGTKDAISYSEAVNAITGAAQLSRLSFTEVTQAFRQAAPVANSANISIGDLAAVIATLGNASETGTLSGTSLKQVILDLESPSKRAAETLNEFGVSIFDSAGALRPFRDVVNDMNKAFGENAVATGKATDQTRLKALADIFGSRAALAANIITNQGVKAFDDMKAAMESVKAVDMANVMLLPLDARLTILTNSAQALAITFAGPFVSALSDAANAGIDLIRNTTGLRDAVELAGQAIVAIATNSGFGALQTKLEELADPKLLSFFTSLIGFGSSVRAALMDVIVPALQSVISRMVEFASNQDTIDAWSRALDNAGTVVLNIASVIGGAIGIVADFVGWIRENQVALDVLQSVVVGFASVIVGTLLAAFVAVAVPIAVVTLAMGVLGLAVVTVATDIQVFADAIMSFVAVPAQEAADIVVEAGAVMAEGAIAGAEGVLDAYGVIVEGSAALAEAVIGNTQVMVEGVIDADNAMIEGTAESWDEIVNVTDQGVKGVGVGVAKLDPILNAVANVWAEAAPGWASALNGLLSTLGSFVTQAFNMVKSFIASLGDNPLFASIAGGLGGGPVGFAVVSSAAIAVKAFNTISNAVAGTNAQISRIGTNVATVTANFQNMEGRLRSSLDNISSSAARAREGLARVAPGANTGNYPEGGGGSGGGGRGGGAGRGPGAGPEVAYNRAIDQAVEFADDLARTIMNAGTDAINRLEDVARKAADAASIATREYFEKIEKIEIDYVNGVVERGATLAQSRQDREQKQLFDEGQKQDQRRRSDGRRQRDEDLSDLREGQDRYTKRVQDILDKQFQYFQQEKALKRSYERADEETAFKRKLDDEERRLQKLEDLRNKTVGKGQTEEDRQKMRAVGGFSTSQDTDQLEKRRLARTRAREDMETQRSRDRAREDELFNRDEAQIAENRRAGIENTALELRHARMAEDRKRQRDDETSDLQFSNQQAADKQKFEDDLQDEALRRTNEKAKQKLIDDRVIQGREHKEKLDAITKRSLEEGQAIITGLEKTLRGVEDKIKDKVPEILKSGGEAMQPILDDLIGKINEQMDAVWEGANKARKELGLGEGSSVLDSMVIGTDNFITASVTFTQAMIDAAQRIMAAGAAIGGPSPVPAPGGGTVIPGYTTGSTSNSGLGFTPSPSQYSPLPSVGNGIPINPPQTLPSSNVVAPGATQVNVTNNTNYSVDASYASVQSPASIAMDLGALSAISRR